MTDKQIILYHEAQEERMAREICRLKIIIDNLNRELRTLKREKEKNER